MGAVEGTHLYQHRPMPCGDARFSILDDFTEDYDEESEAGKMFLALRSACALHAPCLAEPDSSVLSVLGA